MGSDWFKHWKGDNMDNEFELQRHPPWREALTMFDKTGFAAGDVVSYDWLYNAFSIVRPGDDTRLADAESAKLQFLGQFKSFENSLLRERQTALANVKGLGYRVIPAAEQTQWAEEQGNLELRRALRKRTNRVLNVNLTVLTGQQRKENADALARIGSLTMLARRALERRSVLDIDDDAGAPEDE